MADIHILPGKPAPDTPKDQLRKRLKAHPKPDAMVSCHRCSGREVIQAKIGMVLRNGKMVGGTKVYLCANCHRNGERVVLA